MPFFVGDILRSILHIITNYVDITNLLATNATHKDFNKPTDSRMVAMPMAAS